MSRGTRLIGSMLAAGLALAAAAPAVAQQNFIDPPENNTPAYCRQYASLTGVYIEALYGACLEEEAAALEALAGIWPTLLPAIIGHCYEMSAIGGFASYVLLKECIDGELLTLATTPPYRP